MESYLHKILKSYFKESTKVDGFLLTVESFIKYTENKYSELNIVDDRVAGLRSLFRDLSDLTSKENLYSTGFRYELKISEFKEDIALLVSRECCFALSQVYEIFETYLKNILSSFLFHNPLFFDSVEIKNFDTPSTIQEYRDCINFLQRQGKNNKKLFSTIRKISSFYSKHEIVNIRSFNLNNWYDLISEIRHAIIHNQQKLTLKVQNIISHNRNKEIYDRYFLSEKSYENNIIITDRLKTTDHICLFDSFAYLIFKSLSLETNLDPKYYI
jgi:hypothetical protein